MSDTVAGPRKWKSSLWTTGVAFGVAVASLGLVVLFGWHTKNETLVQIVPSFVPMQYNTALGFVFCGVSLLLIASGRREAAAAAGILASLLGMLTLAQYVGRFNLGIDEFFMEHDITVKTSHPGRMAPNTAICFTLTGLWSAAVLLRWVRTRESLIQMILASLAFSLGMVAFSGYFTELETAYGWGNLTRMAVHTSIGFVLINGGLMLLVWGRDLRGDSWLPRWTPIPIAVAILTATLCLWQAMVATGIRMNLGGLTNLASLMLAGGVSLAAAMALAAYLAQESARRAREIAQTNQALQEEVRTRQQAEAALQAHRDNLEKVVAERTRELDRARLEAVAANRAKSEFLSHMSHELRTPLNGILGYAQILDRDPHFSQQQRNNLQSIVNCGDHLLSLINDVLDLSKIEAGRLEVEVAPTDFHRLLSGMADMVKQRAAGKGVTFTLETSPEVPRGIITDAPKLRQILINLLGNAVKFTNHGAVTLHVAESPKGYLRLQVIDTGVGIDPSEIEEIFDAFKQVEAGKAAGGTGLGLAITRRLCDALGASIDVQSEKGKGSTFTVTLPLVEAEGGDLQELLDSGELEVAHAVLADGQDWTILVADDRKTNRDVLFGMLTGAGFKTLLASDGDEALEMLRGDNHIDLVLMDVRMPRVSGLEALKEIRADPHLRELKVIAVTASVFPEFRKKAIEAGFDDFLGKPFRAEELMGKLKTHLPLEFASAAADSEQPAWPDNLHSAAQARQAVSADVADRLRRALKIKNLTAIKAVAAELSNEPATAAVGQEIAELALAFDFTQLAALADDLEQPNGAG